MMEKLSVNVFNRLPAVPVQRLPFRRLPLHRLPSLPANRRIACPRIRLSTRSFTYIFAVLVFCFTFLYFILPSTVYNSRPVRDPRHGKSPEQRSGDGVQTFLPGLTYLHVLLPAPKPDINLCKTIMSAAILGYSTPTLLAWEEDYDTPRGVFGDSYLAKIIRTQEYIMAMGPERDNDLLLVVDAYDVWFQLRKETIVSRYNKIITDSNARLKKRLGEAWNFEEIRNRVIFGAGKRCSPNDPHSIGCYAVPKAPTREDLYGNNTDRIVKSNKFATTRPRFLNAGYIMGSVKGLRKLFREAREEAEKLMIFEDQVPEDGSIHQQGATYHSDQSVWNVLFGQQEYMREKMRLKYLPETDGAGNPIPREGPRGSGRIDGKVVDNIFDPPFEHPDIGNLGADDDMAREYGITLDYASRIGHQTDSAQSDAMWLQYDQPLGEQLNDTRREDYDCKPQLPEALPKDILDAAPPNQYPPIEWDIQSYYTNVCHSTVPVLVHHDGDKTARERDWSRMWYYDNGKRLFNFAGGGATAGHARSFEAHKIFPRPAGMVNEVGGAWMDTGRFLRWFEVCPKTWEEEVFPSKKPTKKSI